MAVQKRLGLKFFIFAKRDGCTGSVTIFVAVRLVDVEGAAILIAQDVFPTAFRSADYGEHARAVTAIFSDLDVELDGGLFFLFCHDDLLPCCVV